MKAIERRPLDSILKAIVIFHSSFRGRAISDPTGLKESSLSASSPNGTAPFLKILKRRFMVCVLATGRRLFNARALP